MIVHYLALFYQDFYQFDKGLIVFSCKQPALTTVVKILSAVDSSWVYFVRAQKCCLKLPQYFETEKHLLPLSLLERVILMHELKEDI